MRIWPYSRAHRRTPNLRDEMLPQGPKNGCSIVVAGLTVFNGEAVLPVQRESVVIEITIRVRFVQKTVEITKVVVRLGE